jgi:sugar phosphate isomerase/epimerase
MKLGLDSYSYHLAFGVHPDFSPRRRMTLLDFIGRVAALGLDGFQIDPLHLASRDRHYLEEIQAAAVAENLFLEYGTLGIEPRHLAGELAVCACLGSPVLRTFAGFNRHDPRTKVAVEIRRAIAGLRRVRDMAADLGIRIAVENHGDVTTDELLQIIRAVDSPFVGICLDVGNPLLTQESPLPAVEKMAPFAVTTHCKDYAVRLTNYGCKITGVALGEGIIDLPATLKLLQDGSTLDRLILEIPVEARGDEPQTLAFEDDCVRRSVAFAREQLGLRSGRRQQNRKPSPHPAR